MVVFVITATVESSSREEFRYIIKLAPLLKTSCYPLCWKKIDLPIGKVSNLTPSGPLLLSTSCWVTSYKMKSGMHDSNTFVLIKTRCKRG